MKIDIANIWDNMTIDEKLKILYYNYPFDFRLHRQAFIDFCNYKFNELSDIHASIKNVITNALKGDMKIYKALAQKKHMQD